jgi:hypothetical protein
MNAIHQISLKLRLGIDPAHHVEPDQLLLQWKLLSEQSWQDRARAIRDGKSFTASTPAKTNPQRND